MWRCKETVSFTQSVCLRFAFHCLTSFFLFLLSLILPVILYILFLLMQNASRYTSLGRKFSFTFSVIYFLFPSIICTLFSCLSYFIWPIFYSFVFFIMSIFIFILSTLLHLCYYLSLHCFYLATLMFLSLFHSIYLTTLTFLSLSSFYLLLS